jgi:DNA-binding response OmpR family regulator
MILLVDDDPDATFLLAMHLERASFRVVTAATLCEARAQLPNVDVVVSDRRLDGEDGLQLFQDGRPDNVRFALLLTGDDIPPDVVLDAQFDAMSKKPVDAQQVITRIKTEVPT